jgi:hypothetical protein
LDVSPKFSGRKLLFGAICRADDKTIGPGATRKGEVGPSFEHNPECLSTSNKICRSSQRKAYMCQKNLKTPENMSTVQKKHDFVQHCVEHFHKSQDLRRCIVFWPRTLNPTHLGLEASSSQQPYPKPEHPFIPNIVTMSVLPFLASVLTSAEWSN